MNKEIDWGGKFRKYAVNVIALLSIVALAWSFWSNDHWTQLCAGLAFFLFGMQCLEEGLRNLAGETLETTLARSTSTPFKSFMIGVAGTTVLQSSTVVSLMTIAFISTGLIGLAAGIAIIFGANLGAVTGIWLLAFAGQSFSLGPLALPLVVFGVLASFRGPNAKAAGRILLGIAFIFLGIDEIKNGFTTVTENLDLTQYPVEGVTGQLIFAGLGLVLTMVLQSTHATLMLTLTALALGQVDLMQSACISIGAKVGSSVTTGLAGALGGNRSGQRLALAHVLFNVVTTIATFILLIPLIWLTRAFADHIGFSDNNLIMLAIFNTVSSVLGVLLLWPSRDFLARLLVQWLPETTEPRVLIPVLEISEGPAEELAPVIERSQARYITPQALQSFDAAAHAVMNELMYMGRLSLEVICYALYLPVSEIDRVTHDRTLLRSRPDDNFPDADTLYQRHIKGVYGDLMAFMSHIDMPSDDEHRSFWIACQLAALQLVETVKDAKHLQKNLGYYLRQPDTPARDAYVEMRRHLISVLHDIRELGNLNPQDPAWNTRLEELDRKQKAFETRFRSHIFAAVRDDRMDGLQLSSLLNDLGYAGRISRGLRELVMIRADEGNNLLRDFSMTSDEAPLIILGAVPM